ncbi:hypothetical protein J3R80_00200 [Aliiroseovarius sp. Z3]|uniref:hypothetical protein n=1 Tax=Aliiroseovarius sp. Z3 TaxID=2811402 RepID=UPI0023B21317|nr:hypothetical protein [Aliiroseovarius sp. Z3]MDE9448886.1 hypothetical protein [Aliiroseovarius sp. Z3]
MLSLLKRMWAAAPVATIILAVALGLSVFFGVRTTTSWIYWTDPAHIDQPIEGWMTPRYVAMSWDVPRDVMMNALRIDRPEDGPPNLARLAEARGVTLDALIAEIEAAIAAHRAAPDNKDRHGPQ